MESLTTLAGLLPRMESFGDRDAVLALNEDAAERVSFAELAARARAFAGVLSRAGLERGSHVALLAEPGPHALAAALGAIFSGASAMLVDVQSADATLERILKDSAAVLVVTNRTQAERLERLENVPRTLFADGEEQAPDFYLADAPREARNTDGASFEQTDSAFHPHPEDEAALFYTSGTTGPPKGVPLSHANLVFQINTVAETRLLTEADRLLLPLPLHHVYPMVIGVLMPLALGLPIVIPHSLTGPQLVRALAEGEVTVIAGVPRLYQALYSAVTTAADSAGFVASRAFRLLLATSRVLRGQGLNAGKLFFGKVHRRFGGRVRLLASGGSPLDPALAADLEALGFSVAIGYGLTETSPLLTIKMPGGGRLDTVGRPVPGVQLRIDRDAAPQPGQDPPDGEVVAHGPPVFSGYRNLPEKTREVFTDDGWFRTGDLGRFEDGFLRLSGRASTLIVTRGGENVQPDEVEDAIAAHPFIREAGVLERDGRLAVLLVPDLAALREAGEADAESAVKRALANASRGLASYKRPGEFRLTREPLERTRLGKVRRHLLEKAYEAAGGEGLGETGPMDPAEMAPEDRDLLDGKAAGAVWEMLARRYPDAPLAPDASPQLELGVDSLEWLDLTMEIRERTGVELDEETISGLETVRDLLQAVAEAADNGSPEAAGSKRRVDPLEQPEEALSDEEHRWLLPVRGARRVLAFLLYAFVWLAMRLLFRLEVRGREHLPDRADEPFVITPNHASYLDPFAVVAALPFARLRNVFFAGWTGAAFQNPVFAAVSRLAQTVPIDPARGVRSSLAFGAALLARGRSLVWFPEGRRSSDGELQPLKRGLGLLLDRRPARVVPTRIDGTFEAWPPGQTFFRPGRVRITFFPAVSTQALHEAGAGGSDPERIMAGLRAELERAVAEPSDT